ncbi:hypothetical protein QQG91_03240 [Marivivens sp. LCG002]|uniref:hypothetical protein n=1 Tax=Marivivens sp. LCG002 TaxID=3051171 RepID=UPI0025556213|nr:hypothetical protein [Marivivens sp. LCG002]WIV51478.1 hypothetical protein QQG91_03240 [Marivivens sp. LCG002]
MTALKQYERLESLGLWREHSEAQRREVVVSFGNATLVIADNAERPIAHWSLAAIERLNAGEMPALFAPDEEASETLEIEDETMVNAIETVRKSLLKSRPKPGRLRQVSLGLSVAAVLALGVFWLPNALVRQTISVAPMTKRAEIGTTLLGHSQRLTGSSCRNPLGMAALERLRVRLFPAQPRPSLVVVPDGISGAMPLPGNIIMINRKVIENTEDPAVTAGYILTARAIAMSADPLEEMLRTMGIRATFTLLTTGNLPPDALSDYAEALITTPPSKLDNALLYKLFEETQVATGPFAKDIDPSGANTQELIESDTLGGERGPVILSDGDWVALQGICG